MGRNDELTKRNDTLGAPHLGAQPWEVGQWPNPTGKMPEGRLAESPGQGTTCRVPSSPRSATLLDVSPSLEDQTIFKIDKTKIVTTVSKRTSQRRKNHIDTMSAL